VSERRIAGKDFGTLGVWTEKDLEQFEPNDKKVFWKIKFLAGDLIGRIFGMLHGRRALGHHRGRRVMMCCFFLCYSCTL